MKKIKHRIYEIISPATQDDTYSRMFDLLVMILIILNVATIVISTFDTTEEWLVVFSYSVEIVCVLVFGVEYLLRLWTSDLLYPECGKIKARIKYIFSFMAIIDLLSIMPFTLPFIPDIDQRVADVFRIIRLLRVFKLHRYTSALSSMQIVLKRKASQLTSSVSVIILLTIITSIIIYNIESEAQPDVFINAFSGFWWSVATFTTVGYGDIVPITTVGKLFSSFIAFLGLGLIAVPTGIISAGYVELDNERHEKELKKIVTGLEQGLEEDAQRDKEIKRMVGEIEQGLEEDEERDKAISRMVKRLEEGLQEDENRDNDLKSLISELEQVDKVGEAKSFGNKCFCPYCGNKID